MPGRPWSTAVRLLSFSLMFLYGCATPMPNPLMMGDPLATTTVANRGSRNEVVVQSSLDKIPNVSESAQSSRAADGPVSKPPITENSAPQPVPKETLPQPEAAAVKLTLDRAINTTLLADPKIRGFLEAISQANADLTTASLPPNPTLYMDAQLLPLTRPFNVKEQGGPPQADVLLSYPVDWFLFGKRAAAMASASHGVKATEYDYADRVRLRVTDTAVAFFDVLEAKSLLNLARQDIDNFTRIEAATRKAVEAGGRPNVDLNRVRLDLLTSQRAFRDAEVALVNAQAHLRSLLGRTDADPDFEIDGDLTGPITVEPVSAEEVYAIALENRPDLQSDRYKIAQAEANIRIEDLKARPQVTPQIGYIRQFQQKAIGFPDANSYLVSLTTTLPCIDRNQGNRAKARSVAVQWRYDMQADLVDLRAEVDQITKQFRTAYQNATAVAGEQLKLATEVRDSINKAYASGGRPLIDALDAERNFRDTYRLYISGRANYWRALYKLNAAAGKQVAK